MKAISILTLSMFKVNVIILSSTLFNRTTPSSKLSIITLRITTFSIVTLERQHSAFRCSV